MTWPDVGGEECSVHFLAHRWDGGINEIAVGPHGVWLATTGGATRWQYSADEARWTAQRFTELNGLPYYTQLSKVTVDGDGNAIFLAEVGIMTIQSRDVVVFDRATEQWRVLPREIPGCGSTLNLINIVADPGSNRILAVPTIELWRMPTRNGAVLNLVSEP